MLSTPPRVLSGSFQLAQTTNPDSQYLIESRTRFTDTDNYIASEYFLTRMGIDPQTIGTTILADAWTEQQLIQDSIAQISHTAYLDADVTSINQQMQQLYDNAIDVAEDLNLSIGVKLSAAQIAALRQDIIWYETEIINNQAVLVPKLYLGVASRDNIQLHNGSLLAADDIDLDIAADFSNSGSVYAANNIKLDVQGDIRNIDGNIQSGGNLSLVAANILNETSLNDIAWFTGSRDANNQAGITAAGNLLLTASNRLDNIGGRLKAGNHALLKAQDINNKTTLAGYDNGRFARTRMDGLASIETAGSLQLQGGNFTDTAGSIKTGDNFIAKLDGDMRFDSLKLKTSNFRNQGDWKVQQTQVDHQVSKLDIGANLQAVVAGDVDLIGTQAKVAEQAQIVAGGNYTQQSVINTALESAKKEETNSGWFSRSRSTKKRHKQSSTHQASTLSAGKGLSIQTAGNINLLASKLNTDSGNLSLTAGGDLNLLSGVNQETQSYSKQKKGTFTQSSKGAGSASQEAAHFALQSGGNLILNAKNNIDLLGGKIATKDKATIGNRTLQKDDDGNIKTDSLGRIVFKEDGPENVKTRALILNNSNYSYKKEGLTGVAADLVKGVASIASVAAPLVKFDVSVSQEQRQNNQASTAVGTDIKADKLNIMGNNLIDLEAVNLNVENTAYLKAKDVNITAAEQTQIKAQTNIKESIGSDGAKISDDEVTIASQYRQKDQQTERTEHTTYQQSKINAGNLIIDADNDITLTALDLKATAASLKGNTISITGINEELRQQEQQRTEKKPSVWV